VSHSSMSAAEFGAENLLRPLGQIRLGLERCEERQVPSLLAVLCHPATDQLQGRPQLSLGQLIHEVMEFLAHRAHESILRAAGGSAALIDVAAGEADEHPEDPALRVRRLDGRADLLFDADDFGKAKDVAQQALTSAQELNGPLTVLQARTTMAMACLRLDDVRTASREIGRAAPYRREGRSLVVLALRALIAFRADPDAEGPRRLFTKLEREAVQRRECDIRDFAAWDFEGLAICGTRVGRAGSLDSAITAFRRAREQAVPPGLNARMRFWLGILQTKASLGQLDPVLAAAVGTAARPELP